MRRIDCHDRIKNAVRSYEFANKVARAVLEIRQSQAAVLESYDLESGDLMSLTDELHDVYFVQIFAVFESNLRNYWRAKVKNTRPQTKQLLDSLGARRGVPQFTVDTVQKIREYRNSLVHEEHDVEIEFTIDEAKKHLNTFLARLPLEW